MPTQTAKCQEKKSDLVQAALGQSETHLREQGRARNLTGTSFRGGSLGTYRSLSWPLAYPQEVGASPLYR